MSDQQKTDHAELGRLAEMAEWLKRGDDGAEGSVLLSASVSAEHAADLQALLSENATLRAERDEAVGLLRLFDTHLGDDDATWTDGSTVSSEWITPDGIRQSLTFGLFRQVRTFLQSIARETGK